MKTKYFICLCGGEILRIYKYKNDPETYLTKYHSIKHHLSLFNRIILAISYVIKPKKFDIYNPIILDRKNAKQLGKFLLQGK